MKLFPVKRRFKLYLIKVCSRWSIFIALILYVSLFTLIIYMKIPLKSDDKLNHLDKPRGSGDNNIIEYLHRLHNLKVTQELTDEERDKIKAYYDLEDIFHKADTDHDTFLSLEEISQWINMKTQEHIHEAIIGNYKMFTAIDVRPKDGLISWNEYHFYFLERNGMNKSYALEHTENHKELPRIMKEAIMRDKAAWSECAKTDPDHLTLDEFLSFRHPESSYSSIISLVDEIYKKFDRDGDDILTEDEFSTLQSEDEFEKSAFLNQEEYVRREEFREMVDLDKDGKATRKEMLNYIDPKNPRHAKEEAETLLLLADLDKDRRLSLKEVFNKIDLFLGSKMVDNERNFHDEF